MKYSKGEGGGDASETWEDDLSNSRKRKVNGDVWDM